MVLSLTLSQEPITLWTKKEIKSSTTRHKSQQKGKKKKKEQTKQQRSQRGTEEALFVPTLIDG